MRIATISTINYRPELERLLYSLKCIHPHATVRVYVDDLESFANLPGAAEVIVLPEIARLGPKRAKFTMYHREMRHGPFIYLDADVIVLDDLTELLGGTHLVGCRDELLACPFVADRERPWPGDPELVNRIYINCGVMGFGPEMGQFTGRMVEMVEDEAFWRKYIHPGGLFDNHVICALINLLDMPVTLLPEQRFNWQGFRNNDMSLAAVRRGPHLVHAATGHRLHLVHFAGFHDIDSVILRLPPEIAQRLNEVSVPPLPPERALGSIWAEAGARLNDADPHRGVVAMILSRELAGLCKMPRENRLGRYFENYEAGLSTALTTPPSRTRWNDLQCGGAYLEPDEYAYLRDLVRQLNPAVLVEFGAGETTGLFRSLAKTAISIEPNAGPWLERARASGAQVYHVPFSVPTGFDAAGFENALANVKTISLLFVDSPNGGQARSIALRQILGMRPVNHIVFHDSRRDAGPLLAVISQTGDYVVAETYQSLREFMVVSRRNCSPLRSQRPASPPLNEYAARMEADFATVTLDAGQATTVMVAIQNCSNEPWAHTGPHAVTVSYHLGREGKHLVFDGVRTPLPCPMLPGDRLTLPITIAAHGLPPGLYDLEVCLVEESRSWFEWRSTLSILNREARVTSQAA